jgi:DNA-binding MarR family transcriptional regulator
MATPQQVDTILSCLRSIDPSVFIQMCSDRVNGGQAVLKLLYMSKQTVTAGYIAQYMGVSTARVAVLLRKLSCKGFIEKHRDVHDARVTVVQLTEKGAEQTRIMQQQIRTQIETIIDRVGMERLMAFMETGSMIYSSLSVPEKHI